MCVQMDTVIADQHSPGYLSGTPGEDQIERQPRLAGARWPADQHGTISHQHGRSVDAWACTPRHGAGSLTTKRAPATVGSPSALAGPARFSAQIRPPRASMIFLGLES